MGWISVKGQFEVSSLESGKIELKDGFGTRTEEHSCSLAPQPFVSRHSWKLSLSLSYHVKSSFIK